MSEGKRAVFIIAREKFRDEEFVQPKKILEEKGIKATVFSSCAEQIKEKGAIYTGHSIEQDNGLNTASGPESAHSFGQALLQALQNH